MPSIFLIMEVIALVAKRLKLLAWCASPDQHLIKIGVEAKRVKRLIQWIRLLKRRSGFSRSLVLQNMKDLVIIASPNRADTRVPWCRSPSQDLLLYKFQQVGLQICIYIYIYIYIPRP